MSSNKSLTWFLCQSITLLIGLSSANLLFAHHPVAAKFDLTSSIALTGRVTEIDWANPHVHIFIQVDESSESAGNWAVELESTIDLEQGGWTADDLSIGDILNVQGLAARDGSEQLWGERISRTTDGLVLFTLDEQAADSRLSDRPEGPTPRWPDGQPRLGPLPGQTGYWINTGSGSLVEEGQRIAMDAEGVLANIEDADRVAPFQDWAKDLYVMRQRNSLRDDPLYLLCIPPGGPRQFQLPYGVQLVEQRNRDRLFVLMGSGNRNWRLIYTDQRNEVSQVSGNDDNPLFYGRSLARWEDDTLVVNSGGFNEGFWFSNGGLPHTRLLQLEERFTRSDLNTLSYSVTVNDPGTYTRPWTSSWNLQWVPGEEMPEYYCQDNRQ